MNAQTTIATQEFIQQEIARGRQYFILFFKPGPNKSLDSAAVADDQVKHLEHLFSLKLQGKLPVFGPVLDSPDLEGIGIFDAADKEEVGKLIEEDVHIKSGADAWFNVVI